MKKLTEGAAPAGVAIVLGLALTSCGIATYPGQPGVKTNGQSRLDYEVLDDDGLWIYETSYDNSKGGAGVDSITTRLYSEVYTYSSNARTNADGTYYRHKLPYRGSSVQMISFPSRGEVYVPEDSKVKLMVDYEVSMNEIDDRNLTEENIFTVSRRGLRKAADKLKWQFDTLRKAQFDLEGGLSYQINSLSFQGKVFKPKTQSLVKTNLVQNGITVQMSAADKGELLDFINDNFPSGFSGSLTANVNDQQTITKHIKIHTLDTLATSGVHVIETADIEKVWLDRVASTPLERSSL